MDASHDDVANQAPRHAIRIDRMGVHRQQIPVWIRSPFQPRESLRIDCSIVALADVAANRRGIHLSRIGNEIALAIGTLHDSLPAFAARLARKIAAAEQCASTEVTVSGVLTYLENVPGSKRKQSLEHLRLTGKARLKNGRLHLSTGLAFNHLTACPCVQQTYKHSMRSDRAARSQSPLLTHSQRCATEIAIDNVTGAFDLLQLLSCIDRTVVRCQNTLPRPQELLAVFRAHQNPQFLEDAMRDLSMAVCAAIGKTQPDATVSVSSRSMESIHDFDILGEIVAAVAHHRVARPKRSLR